MKTAPTLTRALICAVAGMAATVAAVPALAGGTSIARNLKVESLENRTPEQRAAQRAQAHEQWERLTHADRSAAKARAEQLKARWEAQTDRERARQAKRQKQMRKAQKRSDSGAQDGLN